jgi:hypothetical protein
MSDDPPDDPAARPPPDKPVWRMNGHEKLLWLRAQREANRPLHRQPVFEVDDNAARDDEYDPFAR